MEKNKDKQGDFPKVYITIGSKPTMMEKWLKRLFFLDLSVFFIE